MDGILTQRAPTRLHIRLRRFVLITELFAIVLAGACTAPGEDLSPVVVLERADREGFWRASWSLDRPTGYLRFQRPATFYREDVWEVITPGWQLDRQSDHQVLLADPGAESDRLVVEFPVYTENIQKEYELFGEFSDGSVAIYSGHFYVTTSGPDVVDDEAEFVRRVEVTPLDEERVVLQGEVIESRYVWEDPQGDGTYIYFGKIEPVETSDMIGIIDPGAPEWILAELRETLPKMFTLYTGEFAEPLPWKPVVLFSFDNADIPGLSSGGGTLTGVVQMSARGKGWNKKTMDTTEQLLYLIAHEAAHFWNGQIHSYEELSDSWMHEGSADAFASIVLLGQGAIDSERLAQRWTKALDNCAMGLMDGSVSASMSRGQFGNYYSCGEIIAVWSAASLPGAGGTERLFDIWRAVFFRSNPETGKHNKQVYFETLVSLGADEAVIDVLADFIDTEHDDPAAALVSLMNLVGIELEQPERPMRMLRRDRAARALRHLMSSECNGRYSFNTAGPRLRAFPVEGCEPFSREMLIVSIEGFAVEDDGDLAFEAVTDRCRRNDDVSLQLEKGETFRVPCSGSPAPLPAPLAFPLERAD